MLGMSSWRLDSSVKCFLLLIFEYLCLSKLTYSNIRLGVILKDSKLEFIFNNLIILAKYFLYF